MSISYTRHMPYAYGLAVCFACLLTGCASSPPQIEYRTVPVPIPVPCAVEVPVKPEWERGKVDLQTASKDRKIAALEAELDQREAYEIKLEAANRGCASPK